jgi:hypothetical protein
MRVIECSSFYNENELLDIKTNEGKGWVDEFRISESSHTFKYQYKGYELKSSEKKSPIRKLMGLRLLWKIILDWHAVTRFSK